MFTCFICVNSCINLYLSLLRHREKRLLNITSNNWRRRALLTCPAGYLLPSPPHLTNLLSAQPELSQHAAAEFTPAPQMSCQALRMVRWIILLPRERVLINIIMWGEWNDIEHQHVQNLVSCLDIYSLLWQILYFQRQHPTASWKKPHCLIYSKIVLWLHFISMVCFRNTTNYNLKYNLD